LKLTAHEFRLTFGELARYTAAKEFTMNQMEREFRPDGLAELEYLDGEYRVVRAGSFVLCAVTETRIPLEALRYWSVDLQEAYATPDIALKRFQESGLTPK
jgi:hypothetical protein